MWYNTFMVLCVVYYNLNSFKKSTNRLKGNTIQSKIIRKLNPMNNPKIPPMSATNERIGYASCSLNTLTVGSIMGVTVAILSSSLFPFSILSTSFIVQCHDALINIYVLNPTNIQWTYLILHESTWYQTLSFFQKLFFVHPRKGNTSITILFQHWPIDTKRPVTNIEFIPVRLASSFSNKVFFYTISKIILRVLFAWILWSVDILMSYCLQNNNWKILSILDVKVQFSYL